MSRREKENVNNVGCKEDIRIILNVKPWKKIEAKSKLMMILNKIEI